MVMTHNPRNRVVSSQRVTDGTFEFNRLLSGPTIVLARAREMAPAVIQFDLEPGATRSNLTLRLQQEARLDGIVTGSDGSPIRATVGFRYEPTGFAAEFLNSYIGGRLRTQEDGYYLLTGIIPGVRFSLSVDSPAGRWSQTMVLQPGQQRRDISIVP
jgi:hypothetical protein